MSDRNILYLEPIGGIAGDMFLAAALDLGVSLDELKRALSQLEVSSSFELVVSRAERHAITGTHLDVQTKETPHHHRHLSEICALIRGAGFSPRAEGRALAVFAALGEAESKIHGVPLEQVHFHEVGAVDSIVDICGAAVVLELLGDPMVWSAPPPLGSGVVETEHGAMPIPAPATLELVRGLPVLFEGQGERTTPTGAALLRVLAKIQSPGAFVVERVGYGVGTRDWADRPNVLRASLGRPAVGSAQLVMLELNLDDCTPQLLGWLLERALKVGALDAYVVPATMKKSRPGHLFCALVPAEKKDLVASLLLAESTTLGVRWYGVERKALGRRTETISTSWGEVLIKLGLEGDKVVNVQPEYEDCRRIAEKNGVPLKQVIAEALATYLRAR